MDKLEHAAAMVLQIMNGQDTKSPMTPIEERSVGICLQEAEDAKKHLKAIYCHHKEDRDANSC